MILQVSSSFLLALAFHISCTSQTQKSFSELGSHKGLIEECKKEIPAILNDNEIPGLSIAFMNKDSVIWAAGFGQTGVGTKVTENSVFSLQSISKTFTATAILIAVQDGILNLNTPISHYLPGFKLNSTFQKNPEQMITLNHLLRHRSGLPHEAPVGNNFNSITGSWNDHIESIQDSWLKFTVGEHYSYSNLGYDLAGYILEKQTGMSLNEYITERIFKPLKMNASTFDHEKFETLRQKTLGHFPDRSIKMPVYMPMLPAGGMFSNVLDLSKYVRYHLNDWNTTSEPILDNSLLETMYCGSPLSKQSRYALGLNINNFDNQIVRVGHNGGGFGYSTFMAWYPQLDFGLVLLSNQEWSMNALLEIERMVLNQISTIAESPLSHTNPQKLEGELRLRAEKWKGFYLNNIMTIQFLIQDDYFGLVSASNGEFIPIEIKGKNWHFIDHGVYWVFRVVEDSDGRPISIINENNALEFFYDPMYNKPGSNKQSWKMYLGRYRTKLYGKVDEVVNITINNGHLFCDNYRLSQKEQTVFYTIDGERISFSKGKLNNGNVIYKRD